MGGGLPSSLTFRFNSSTTSGIPQELQQTLSKNEAQKQTIDPYIQELQQTLAKRKEELKNQTIDPSIQELQQTLAKRKEELKNLEQDTKSGLSQERKAALEQQITMLEQRESLFLNRRATLQHEITALEQQITTHRESIFLTLRATLKKLEMNERALALLPTAEELRALDVTVPPGQKGVAVALSEGKNWPGGGRRIKTSFCARMLRTTVPIDHSRAQIWNIWICDLGKPWHRKGLSSRTIYER